MKKRLKQMAKRSLIGTLTSPVIDSAARAITRSFAPILMFHRFQDSTRGISGHDPAFVRYALKLLDRRGYHFVDLDLAIRAMQGETDPLPAKSIVLTMDDGFIDQAEIGARLFTELGYPVTCFLITGFLDGILWPWDDQVRYCLDQSAKRMLELKLGGGPCILHIHDSTAKAHAAEQIRSHMKNIPQSAKEQLMALVAIAADVEVPHPPPPEYAPMSWQQARQLESAGVTFGPHTVTHNILSRQEDNVAAWEVNESISRLAMELQRPSSVFCYPTGRLADFTERDENNIRQAGCMAAVSTEPGYMTQRTSHELPFRLPRFGMPNNVQDLLQYCTWIEYAKERVRRG